MLGARLTRFILVTLGLVVYWLLVLGVWTWWALTWLNGGDDVDND